MLMQKATDTNIDTVSETASIADRINHHHALGHASAETAIEHAIKCGELLIQQKAACAHGEFKAWVNNHCTFAYQTASRYMKAVQYAKIYGVDFSLSKLYLPKKKRVKRTRRGKGSRIITKSGRPKKADIVTYADPIQEEGVGCQSQEARWQHSAASFLGDALAMQAYWDREFPGWSDFERPSTLLALNADAIAAFRRLSEAVGRLRSDGDSQ